MLSRQAPEIVSCVVGRVHELPKVVKLFMLFLQMTAAVGALVLLFAAEAVITAWSGCALARRSSRRTMPPAGRIVVLRMCSWRRAVDVFCRGTASRWTSDPPSWNRSPELAPAGAEVRDPSPSGPRMKLLECSVGDR